MITISKSDLINIQVYKGLLKTVSNDIQDAKNSNTPPRYKASLVFKLSAQRANLIQNATKNYPDINWITEVMQEAKPFADIRREVILSGVKSRLRLK